MLSSTDIIEATCFQPSSNHPTISETFLVASARFPYNETETNWIVQDTAIAIVVQEALERC